MGTQRRFDFQLGGQGYILARDSMKGRAWLRTGMSDAPSRRSPTDAQYGQLPDEVDHPEVWDDWSGGFGQAYRRNGENTYHWAENFDPRFPRQLVHAQQLRLAPQASFNIRVNNMIDLPWSSLTATPPVPDVPGVMVYGDHWLGIYQPFPGTVTLNYGTITASAGAVGSIGECVFLGRAVTVGSFAYVGIEAVGVATVNTMIQIDRNELINTTQVPASGLCVAGNRVWRYSRGNPQAGYRNNIQSAAAIADITVTANWSATLKIGNNFDDVQDLISLDDQLYAGTPSGLYAGDQSGSFFNVLSEIGNQRHSDNCRDLTVHNGAVIAPHIAGLFSYRPGFPVAEVREIGPTAKSNKSPIRGNVRAVRSFGKWLYAGLYTGSESFLMAGRESYNGFAWHPMQRLPHKAKISRIHFDGITTTSGNAFRLPNRMWLATEASIDTGGTAPLYWSPVPLNNDNPLASDPVWSANYIGSARIDLGAVDWGAPSTPKVYRSVEIWSDNLASGAQWCDVYYTVDANTRIRLGTVAQSPKDTLFFASDGHGANNVLNPEANTGLNFTTIGTNTTLSETTALGAAYQGSRAFALFTDTANEGGSFTLSALPNLAHYVTFWARPLAVNLKVSLDGGSNYVAITALTTSNTHTRYGAAIPTAQANGSTALRIVQSGGGSGTNYIDTIKVEAGTAPSTDSFVVGQNVALSLESFTASAAISPVYRAIVLRGALLPQSNDQITAVVRIADGMKDRQGGTMRSAATMIQELRNLAAAATPITLVDLAGAASNVTLLGKPEERETYQQGSDEPEVLATVKLAVLTFT